MICQRLRAPASKRRPPTSRRREGRRAFTLVELLVSMALIVFIMTILSAAFGAASKAFRDLKSVGDMAEKLRGALTLMRRDLAAPHFDPSSTPIAKLGDGSVWGPPGGPNSPPSQGFFRIWQDQQVPITQLPPPPPPGQQPTENPTYIASRSMLHFTVTLPGLVPSDFFATQLPTPLSAQDQLLFDPANSLVASQENRYQNYQPPGPGGPTLRSRSAEVAYWLSPSLDADGVTPSVTPSDVGLPAQPLFTLRRRQRLLWPEGGAPSATVNTSVGPGYEEISAPAVPAGPVPFNRMNNEVTIPAFRLGMSVDATPYTGAALPTTTPSYAGWPTDTTNVYPITRPDDVLVTDVLSFDVRILVQGDTEFVDLYDPRPTGLLSYSNNNLQFQGAGPRVFDTWSAAVVGRYDYSSWQTGGTAASIPLFRNPTTGQLIQIRAIQITLRVWDAKTQLVRQASMVQDL